MSPFQEIAKKELDNLEEQHQNLVNEIEDLNGKSEKLHKLYDEQGRDVVDGKILMSIHDQIFCRRHC